MNKNRLWLLILAVVGALVVVWAIGNFTTLNNLDEDVQASWGNLQAQYQRRVDLVPNMVAVVKQQAKSENEIFTKIAEARSQVQSANYSGKVTSDQMQKSIDANNSLTIAMGKMLVLQENYPVLKQDQAFSDLRITLEGSENRISVARQNYNEVVNVYNKKIRAPFVNLIASMAGLDKYPYIQSQSGAENVPTVDFNK